MEIHATPPAPRESRNLSPASQNRENPRPKNPVT